MTLAAAHEDRSELNARTASDASALVRLLGPKIRGSLQTPAGEYSSAHDCDACDIVAHFTGEITLALAPVIERKARILAIDIDERFAQRLQLLAPSIKDRHLEAATIATSGSDPGRGKVLVFFARPRSADRLRSLGLSIVSEAQRCEGWGIHVPGRDLTVFPLGGTGGLIRIGGRNRRPDRNAGALDVFFGLDGEARQLQDVVPALRTRLEVEPTPIAPTVGRWVGKLRTEGLTYRGGSKRVYAVLVRLAHEAVRLYGLGGRPIFDSWLADIWKASPELRKPSPTSHDARVERTWGRRADNAWNAAKETLQESHAKETLQAIPAKETLRKSLRDYPRDNVAFLSCAKCDRILTVLAEFVRAKALVPTAFAMTYEQLAEHAGFGSKKTPYKHIHDHLVPRGQLVVHDRGSRRARGAPRMQTIFGIVALGETAGDVQKRGAERPCVVQRQRLRAKVQRT